jgi:hypothetical protein
MTFVSAQFKQKDACRRRGSQLTASAADREPTARVAPSHRVRARRRLTDLIADMLSDARKGWCQRKQVPASRGTSCCIHNGWEPENSKGTRGSHLYRRGQRLPRFLMLTSALPFPDECLGTGAPAGAEPGRVAHHHLCAQYPGTLCRRTRRLVSCFLWFHVRRLSQVAREVGPELWGVASVNLYLLYTTALFLSREGVRRSLL